jgi:hypothetical protein
MYTYDDKAEVKKSGQENSESGERICRGGRSTICQRNIARTGSTAVKQLITKATSRYAGAYFALSVRVVVVQMIDAPRFFHSTKQKRHTETDDATTIFLANQVLPKASHFRTKTALTKHPSEELTSPSEVRHGPSSSCCVQLIIGKTMRCGPHCVTDFRASQSSVTHRYLAFATSTLTTRFSKATTYNRELPDTLSQ